MNASLVLATSEMTSGSGLGDTVKVLRLLAHYCREDVVDSLPSEVLACQTLTSREMQCQGPVRVIFARLKPVAETVTFSRSSTWSE